MDVVIVKPIVIGSRLPLGSENTDVTIKSYRIPVRRRLSAEQQASAQFAAVEFIVDLP